MVIDVNTFYHCRALYIYMPRPVFDALEAAYLEGHSSIEIGDEDYSRMKQLAPAEVWPE